LHFFLTGVLGCFVLFLGYSMAACKVMQKKSEKMQTLYVKSVAATQILFF